MTSHVIKENTRHLLQGERSLCMCGYYFAV